MHWAFIVVFGGFDLALLLLVRSFGKWTRGWEKVDESNRLILKMLHRMAEVQDAPADDTAEAHAARFVADIPDDRSA